MEFKKVKNTSNVGKFPNKKKADASGSKKSDFNVGKNTPDFKSVK